MPRRRATRAIAKPRPIKRSDSKLKRWNKISDIPLDDEDEFHALRDKILLEGDGFSRDQDEDEDEVFALQGLSEDDDDEEEDNETDDEGEGNDDEDPDIDSLAKSTAKKSASKKGSKRKTMHSSSSESESESEEETWGHKKSAYYSSNAADLDSDDEEGNELEVQEAKRLQAKTREALTDCDFGLEDPIDISLDKDDVADLDDMPLPQVLLSNKKSAIWQLEDDETESQAVARDWEETAQSLRRCQEKIIQLDGKKFDTANLGLLHLRYQALLTYATTLAFYKYLSSCDKFAQQPELIKSHNVTSRLLTLKSHLATLDFITDSIEETDPRTDDNNGVKDNDELKHNHEENRDPGQVKSRKTARIKSSLSAQQPPKKKRKTTPTEKEQAPLPVFDVVEPVFTVSKFSRSHHDSTIADAYGEVTSLQYADAADKNARRKSLRFHTSKIENTSARRQGARSNAVSGDDDLPYRERQREREERLAKEAATKIRGQGGEDLNGVPEINVREGNSTKDDDNSVDGGEGPDGYYELVKRQSREKKEQKKAQYELEHPRHHLVDDDDFSGPRAVTRTILANKGLTPRRAKSVRNPRVKKRQKFEKAKKKVSSQKAIYKGGIGDVSKYGGERSGISKVVKSISLG